MEVGISIDKLKILKGPDRLLRVRVRFQSVHNLEETLNGFFEIVNSLLLKNHNQMLDFKLTDFSRFFEEIDKSAIAGNNYVGIANGMVAMEILIRKSAIEVEVSYYPRDLEFERQIFGVENYVKIKDIDMNQYEWKYALIDFREGINTRKELIKLS